MSQLVELFDVADETRNVVCLAVQEPQLLGDFALDGLAAHLVGTAGGGGDAAHRVQVVASADGTLVALQANGVEGADAGVGAALHTVIYGVTAVVTPAPDAGDVATVRVEAGDGAGEDAVLDGGVRLAAMAYEATGVVAADVELGRDGAALNEVGAVGKAYDAGGVVLAGGDGACHGEVLDSGSVDVAEEGCALVAPVADVHRDGMATAEEGAAEGSDRGAARHVAALLRHADVGPQLHELAAVAVAVTHIFREDLPFVGRADGEGVCLRATAGERAHRDVGHDFLIACV